MARSRPPLGLLAPFAILGGLWIAWSIWWAVVYHGAQSIYAREVPKLLERGIALSCSRESWSGYPFRVELLCDEPRIAAERNGRRLTAQASRLLAIVQAYNLKHAILLVDGPTRIEVDGKTFALTHDRAAISARLRGEKSAVLGADIPNTVLEGIAAARGAVLNAHVSPEDGATILVNLTGASASFDFGRFADYDEAAAELWIPPELVFAPDIVAAATATAKEIDLKRAILRKGELTVTAQGKASLDPERRPRGKIATVIGDLELFFAEIARSFPADPQELAAAKTMLTLLNAGKTRDVPADLVARDGALYYGPFKLIDLKPL